MTFAWLSIMASLLISHQFADYDNISAMGRMVTKTYALEQFSVVKIEQAARLKIVRADSSQLRYDELIGDGMKPPKPEAIRDYQVKNDTLFIRNLRQSSNGSHTLLVNKLKHLMVYNTWEVDLVCFSQDSLQITAENSNVTISKNSEFSYLYLKSGQKFNLELKSVKEFGMALSEANCNVFGDIEEISGTVGNYARLGIPRETGKVNVDTSINGKLHFVFN